jgi:hypothetical protein
MELCTVFDKNYMLKGLVLYKSIKENNILLNILCIDDITYETLDKLKLENVKLYDLKKIEEENRELTELKELGFKSKYGDSYSQYCWTLTPFFCNYLLKNKKIESLLYIDSDIYFYENFDLVVEEVKDSNIGIVTHRTKYHISNETNSGKYNVGILFFRNNEIGFSCSEFWKTLLLNPKNEYSEKYGTCGDQKYLELFELKYEGICIIDKLVGHGAPWCFQSYDYLDKYLISYNGMTQSLVYNHFSHFKFDNIGWQSSYNGEWEPEKVHKYVNEYYEDYYQEIQNIKKLYNL